MAALIAAAAEPVPDFPLVSLSSEGVTLVYGRDERAIEAAKLLAEHLDVTVLITQAEGSRAAARRPNFRSSRARSAPPRDISARSSLTVDDYAAPAPSSRGALTFGAPRDGAVSRCDLVSISPAARRCFPRTICATAICAPTRAIAAAVLARRAQGARSRRRLRQAALHHVHRGALRAFALAHRRLPPLSRPLPDRRDHAGRQSRGDRSEHLRRLRPMRRRVPDRRRRLRAAARRHAAAQAARAAHDLRAGRRRARDRAAARRAARRAADRGARAPRRRAAGERAAARRQRGDAGRARGGRGRVRLWGVGRCASSCAPSRATTWRACTRRSRSPTRSWPGSASARAASPRSRPTIRSRSARRCARSSRPTARRARAAFTAVGAKRDVLRLALRELHHAAPAPVDIVALPEGAPFGTVRAQRRGLHALPLLRVGLPDRRALRRAGAAGAALCRGRLRAVRAVQGDLPREGDQRSGRSSTSAPRPRARAC